MKTKKRKYSRKRRYSRKRTRKISRKRTRRRSRKRSRKSVRRSRKSVRRRNRQRGGSAIKERLQSVNSSPKVFKGMTTKAKGLVHRDKSLKRRVQGAAHSLEKKTGSFVHRDPDFKHRVQGAAHSLEGEAEGLVHRKKNFASTMKHMIPRKKKKNVLEKVHTVFEAMLSKLTKFKDMETAIEKGFSKEVLFLMSKISGSNVKATIDLVHQIAKDIMVAKSQGFSYSEHLVSKETFEKYVKEKRLQEEMWVTTLLRANSFRDGLHAFDITSIMKKKKEVLKSQIQQFAEEHSHHPLISEKLHAAMETYQEDKEELESVMKACLDESHTRFDELLKEHRDILKELSKDGKEAKDFFEGLRSEIEKQLPMEKVGEGYKFIERHEGKVSDFIEKEMGKFGLQIEGKEKQIEEIVKAFVGNEKLSHFINKVTDGLELDHSLALFCLLGGYAILVYKNFVEAAQDPKIMFEERKTLGHIAKYFSMLFYRGEDVVHNLLYNQFRSHIQAKKDNPEELEELEKIDKILKENELEYTWSTIPGHYTDIRPEDKMNMIHAAKGVLLREAEGQFGNMLVDGLNDVSLGLLGVGSEEEKT